MGAPLYAARRIQRWAAIDCTVVGILLVVVTWTISCASGGCPRGEGYRAVGCHAAAARDRLTYGMSRAEAVDTIGRSEVEPPWMNPMGAGPAVIVNPFDSQTYTSSLGEEYEVVRFFVEAYGNPDCPFLQGRLSLEPLIFVEGKLVGWKWSYLADVLQRRLTDEEVGWNFGLFCDQIREEPPTSDPGDSE
jgi:hypothetical protein